MKFKKRFSFLAVAVLLLISIILPSNANNVIDYVLYTDIRTFINGVEISSYNINGYTAVVVEDLVYYGFDVVWNGMSRTLNVSINPDKATTGAAVISKPGGKVGSRAMSVYATDIITYLDGNKVRGSNVGGKTIIFVDDLAFFYDTDYEWNAGARTLRLNFKGGANTNTKNLVVVSSKTASPNIPSAEEGQINVTAEYYQIELNEEFKRNYPELAKQLTLLSQDAENNALSWLAGITENISGKQIGSYWADEIISVSIDRSDSKVFSLLFCQSDFGMHVYHSYYLHSSAVFDSKTGKELSLSDVITDVDRIPKLFVENAEIFSVIELDDTDFTEEQKSIMLSGVEKDVKNDSLTWTLDDEGLYIYEDALLSFAGPQIYCHLSYKDFPDLFVKKYMPDETADLDIFISFDDNDYETEYTLDELEKYLDDQG